MSIQKLSTKSGTRYRVRLRIGYKPDGRDAWETSTWNTLQEARDEEARLRTLSRQMAASDGSMPLEAYVQRVWWPSLAALAPSTRSTYEKELRLRILPALGRRALRSIDRASIQRMVDGCATESVARKAVGTLRTILNEAKHDGRIAANPADARFSMPPKGRKRDESTVVSRFADMPVLLDAAARYEREEGDATPLLLMATGLLMGLRPEERYALDWEAFDADMELCAVSQAYTCASKAEGGNHLKAPKTAAGRRMVPVPDAARAILEPRRSTGAVILGAEGQRVPPSTARHRVSRFYRWADAEGLNVPYVTIENMRHSFATSYLHAGGNVEDLSRIMGHSDINTTYRRYVRPSAADLARAASAIVAI